jgi:hypothetical protein
MSNSPEITFEESRGIPIFGVDYDPGLMFEKGASKLLAERLVSEYRSQPRSQPPICVLNVKAAVAGSPLVRAIFELYKVVSADSGTLICANYPKNYMESLTTLGLPVLPGFKLSGTVDEAVELALLAARGASHPQDRGTAP